MLDYVEHFEGPQAPTLLLLHGYGSNKEDLFGLQPYFEGFNLVCFQAPHSLGQGGYAWYDIQWNSGTKIIDPIEVSQISKTIEADFDAWMEMHGCIGKRFIGGFSQGGILALSLYKNKVQADGYVVMSGYMLPEWANEDWNKSTPLLQTHGMADPVIPFEWAEAGANYAQSNPNYKFKSYQMGHHLNGPCVNDITNFLGELL